ncbi:alpha/beta hydrolase [Pseudonocardia abyssalis]|uniref:Alpha/beta fold hydrolase n=1 Tax=Pseudonocardia abyssalis TaxID=2792008 RepID=A0ABS6V0W9_9PSEU|nr:alpha/beta hydrolase [Pseudonocardia abyssalis]MBW0114486.1 alpha/beta fold hydrolase [Pseudonocardia abyssalis]MBW0138174.1 alpha/beta fold hydrolase [Pseudonocardia abyssalis]
MIRSARLAAAVAGLFALTACAAPASGSPGSDATAPQLRWSDCASDAALDCATLTVPVDRAEPDGPTFALPVVRIPAGDPANRIGSLVLHRGGPGYSVVDYVTGIRAGAVPDPLTPEVYARYDVIALDQRGAGGSQPAMACADAAPEIPSIPVDDAERDARLAADAAYARSCVANSGEIMDHLSTDEAARDMDALRGALGEERLSFVGQSYGTFLGTVYANLFPEHVGRFVLDSVVDPAQITGDEPLRSTRLGSDVSTAATMQEFLRLCAAGGERCLFGAGDPAGAWDRLTTALREAPVQLTAPDGRTVRLGYSEVVSWAGNWLYQPSLWEQPVAGASFLALAEQALADPTGEAGVTTAQVLISLRDDADLIAAPYAGPLNATAFGVNCAENASPDGPDAFTAAAAGRDTAVPHFGALRAWGDSVCAQWPVTVEGYRGPWAAPTDEPVLIVNSRFDPATPLAAAQRLHDLVPNSALLVHEGVGHVAAQQSTCVVQAVGTYLTEGTVPVQGATCSPDRVPFS